MSMSCPVLAAADHPCSGAVNGETRSGIASVRMRLDGFVHVEPTEPDTPAVLVTRVLVYSGSALLLNADAGGSGQIFVTVEPLAAAPANATAPERSEVVGGQMPAPAAAVRSEPFCGNSVSEAVVWREAAAGDPIARLAGSLVRLRFEIHRAKLYSFQFTE